MIRMCASLRAMSHDDKDRKAERILDLAESLWLTTSFAAFTMQALADGLGMAKGTLYLYFRTKEEVFLLVYKRLLGRWFDAVGASFAGGAPLDPAKAALAMCDALEGVPGLLRMAPLLGALLEKNVGRDLLLAYKRWLAGEVAGAAGAMESAGLGLAPGDGLKVLTLTQSLAAGLYPMAEPGAVARSVLLEPGLEPLRIDFKETFCACLEACLTGLRAGRAAAMEPQRAPEGT